MASPEPAPCHTMTYFPPVRTAVPGADCCPCVVALMRSSEPSPTIFMVLKVLWETDEQVTRYNVIMFQRIPRASLRTTGRSAATHSFQFRRRTSLLGAVGPVATERQIARHAALADRLGL